MSLSKLNAPLRDIAVAGLEASDLTANGLEVGSINVNSGQGGGDGILALNNGNQQLSLSIDNSTKECRIGVANFTGGDVSYPDFISFTPVGNQPTNQYVMNMTGSALQLQNRVVADTPWFPDAPPGVVSYGNSYVIVVNNPSAAADEAQYALFSAGKTVPGEQTIRYGYLTGTYPSGGYAEEIQRFIQLRPSTTEDSGYCDMNLGLPLDAYRLGNVTGNGATPVAVTCPSISATSEIQFAFVGGVLPATRPVVVSQTPGVGFSVTATAGSEFDFMVYG